jgi:hypothetical protein
MLARLAEIMRRARLRGDWDDEAVVLELLAEMREAYGATIVAGDDERRRDSGACEIWQTMIDAIRAEATEPAHSVSSANYICGRHHPKWGSTGRYCAECNWDVMAGPNPDCHAAHTSSELEHG